MKDRLERIMYKPRQANHLRVSRSWYEDSLEPACPTMKCICLHHLIELKTFSSLLLFPYRSSPSSPSEAGTDGLTGTSVPDNTHAFWLGANRGASSPSLISRVTANRLNCVAGINNPCVVRKFIRSRVYIAFSRGDNPVAVCQIHHRCRPFPLPRRKRRTIVC